MGRRCSAASLPRYEAVPTYERVQETRRTITAAAARVFRVRGYSATTISTVAALAGVSPRTLYRYFGSKSELFAAILAESDAQFLDELTAHIHTMPLRDAILTAYQHAEIAIDEESREMMRLASVDEKVWRYFLGEISQMQPVLAAALRRTVASDDATETVAHEPMIWDVRASALLGAIATAYRRWATTPGAELCDLIAAAIDVVLPIATPPRQQ